MKADDAYGEYDDAKIVVVTKDQLPKGENIKEGQQFTAHSEEGHAELFLVTKVEGDNITLDGNHPLAGEDLTFEIEITEVRAATEDEVKHGHAHGPDGHHHH